MVLPVITSMAIFMHLQLCELGVFGDIPWKKKALLSYC